MSAIPVAPDWPIRITLGLSGLAGASTLALVTANVLLLTRGTQLAIETMQVAWWLYNGRPS
jgi:hypothetical protein